MVHILYIISKGSNLSLLPLVIMTSKLRKHHLTIWHIELTNAGFYDKFKRIDDDIYVNPPTSY